MMKKMLETRDGPGNYSFGLLNSGLLITSRDSSKENMKQLLQMLPAKIGEDPYLPMLGWGLPGCMENWVPGVCPGL